MSKEEPMISSYDGIIADLQILGFTQLDMPLSVREVKKRWRDLCRRYHPDKGGDEDQFRFVTNAYECLTNPSYRKRERGGIKQQSLDVQLPYQVSFEEVFFGATIPINFAVKEFSEDGDIIRKKHEEIQTITLNLEPACFPGIKSPIGFRGKGLRRGRQRGDAIVNIALKKHELFRIGEKDGCFGKELYIYSEEYIPLNKCLKGGRIDVQTMYGIKRLKVPAGTRPGDKLPIKGAGLNGAPHFVVVKVHYPNRNELKTKEWSFLGIDWANEDGADAVVAEEQGTKLLYGGREGVTYE